MLIQVINKFPYRGNEEENGSLVHQYLFLRMTISGNLYLDVDYFKRDVTYYHNSLRYLRCRPRLLPTAAKETSF